MESTAELKTPEEKKYFLKEVNKLNLRNFLYDILGFTDMNKKHEQLLYFLQYDKKKFKLILMPRYTFKSSFCTIGYSLWRLAKDPNMRILIYSDAANKAEGFLTGVKNHILGKVKGSLFRGVYGNWEVDSKKDKWNQSQIVISARTTAMPEPNVDTGGIETSKVGFHYDLIIFDDIVSDLNVTTKQQMDKTYDCYQKALSLLRPGGEVFVVGTRWHFGDMYGRLIAENENKETFGTFVLPAIDEKGEYLFTDIGEHSLTKEFLSQQKLQQGSYKFSCLYQNSPVDDESAVFKARDFAFHGDIEPTDLYITCTCDPAGKGEDMTAITIVGTDNEMNMHILEVINEHIQPSEIIDKIINLNYKYKIQMFGIETNFFRGMLRQELDRRIALERVDNPGFNLFGTKEFLSSSKSGNNKDSRIRALQPFHERGALQFPGSKLELLSGGFSELAFQMMQFPMAPHDDILDSLAYHLPLIRTGGVVKNKPLPINSPAELERRSYEKEMLENSRLPRRLRRQIADLAFS
ncbi:MAG: hypothetical protein H8D26_07960 [Methanomicrobia archaeon]|nr:hypothetical protein [Methanomicrobia archaeon]